MHSDRITLAEHGPELPYELEAPVPCLISTFYIQPQACGELIGFDRPDVVTPSNLTLGRALPLYYRVRVTLANGTRHETIFPPRHITFIGRCTCPGDCNCHSPWRPNYCGCREH